MNTLEQLDMNGRIARLTDRLERTENNVAALRQQRARLFAAIDAAQLELTKAEGALRAAGNTRLADRTEQRIRTLRDFTIAERSLEVLA